MLLIDLASSNILKINQSQSEQVTSYLDKFEV